MTDKPKMRRFAAVCPHGSGGHTAEEFEAQAETVAGAHSQFWSMCVGSRYVARIYEWVNGRWTQVWCEGQKIPE